MSYDDRPWLGRYADGQAADFEPEFTDALAMFRASVAESPDAVAIKYFDGVLTLRDLDGLSDAFAVALQANGFERGDRIALYLQNVPQFVIALLAAWKAGGIVVPVNPMSKQRELSYLLKDSRATVLLCLESLYGAVAQDVVDDTVVQLVVTTSELDYQSRDDVRIFKDVDRTRHAGTADFLELLDAHGGHSPEAVPYNADDIAFLTYTSGTTGTPKGAMNTHGNVTYNAQMYRDWCGLTSDDTVLGVAPLFHITGLVAHIAVSVLTRIPLVLAYRFDPAVMLDAIREHRPTFTVGAITVFIALSNTPGVTRADLASMTTVYSGGAPISPAVAQRFEESFGIYLHNVYGLTETTSPSHLVPPGVSAPVDPVSGALSVGVPGPGTMVRIQDDDGRDLPPGEIGEIVTSGPQVVLGYWNKPDETEHALAGRRLRTGDVGFMDELGWFYTVDRKKDLINASGYKVWPREVEDVLYEHPAVREAAVVGVPDEYRGETVKAFVSLKPETTATPEDLIAHCKERLAAYKYPRSVELIDELPKTVTGKVLRRELRKQPG
ncbi:long-chain fatty acid--CoA ligase [Kribbella sp. NPDC049174]|uniref:long-chain-fatty-acid--CoA ligase n=1 Tax=Kribbella sp. NPDC049174 TaxID=3364112 RepID=UPI00371E0D29